MDFLFVRWFRCDAKYKSDWSAKRLPHIGFLERDDCFAFGFAWSTVIQVSIIHTYICNNDMLHILEYDYVGLHMILLPCCSDNIMSLPLCCNSNHRVET